MNRPPRRADAAFRQAVTACVPGRPGRGRGAGLDTGLPAGSTGAGYVLVDTTQGLTSVTVAGGSPATVTAQAGVTMDALTATLATARYGFCHACPAEALRPG